MLSPIPGTTVSDYLYASIMCITEGWIRMDTTSSKCLYTKDTKIEDISMIIILWWEGPLSGKILIVKCNYWQTTVSELFYGNKLYELSSVRIYD